MSVVKMKHVIDPKVAIWNKLKGYEGAFKPLGATVLIAVYERGERTAGNIIIPETSQLRKEDKFQGNVGMVVKMGPLAFRDDADHEWGDTKPAVGDWVVFDVNSAYILSFGQSVKKEENTTMRVAQDVYIRGIVDDPDLVS